MIRPSAAKLDELKVPKNVIVRTAYRAVYMPLYYTMYVGITTVALVTRTPRLEILNSLSNKLFGEDTLPTA